MSFKLIDRVKKTKGIPRRLKGVLEAYLSFGNKDGTEIRPSADKVAERAGCSRWTVNRATQELLEAGVLQHEVDAEGEPRKHYYARGAHWVWVYKVTSDVLQNATWNLHRTCSKMQHVTCSKMLPRRVAKCAATIPSDQTLLYPSASNEAVVSKSVSRNEIAQDGQNGQDEQIGAQVEEPTSLASVEETLRKSTPLSESGAERPPSPIPPTPSDISEAIAAYQSKTVGIDPQKEKWVQRVIWNTSGLKSDNGDPLNRWKVQTRVFDDAHAVYLACVEARVDPLELWAWNQKRKSGGYKFRSMSHFRRGVESTAENNVFAQYRDDNPGLLEWSPQDWARQELKVKLEPYANAYNLYVRGGDKYPTITFDDLVNWTPLELDYLAVLSQINLGKRLTEFFPKDDRRQMRFSSIEKFRSIMLETPHHRADLEAAHAQWKAEEAELVNK